MVLWFNRKRIFWVGMDPTALCRSSGYERCTTGGLYMSCVVFPNFVNLTPLPVGEGVNDKQLNLFRSLRCFDDCDNSIQMNRKCIINITSRINIRSAGHENFHKTANWFLNRFRLPIVILISFSISEWFNSLELNVRSLLIDGERPLPSNRASFFNRHVWKVSTCTRHHCFNETMSGDAFDCSCCNGFDMTSRLSSKNFDAFFIIKICRWSIRRIGKSKPVDCDSLTSGKWSSSWIDGCYFKRHWKQFFIGVAHVSQVQLHFILALLQHGWLYNDLRIWPRYYSKLSWLCCPLA